MSTSARNSRRNASNMRITRSAASQQSSTPNIDNPGPFNVLEDPETYTSRQWPDYVACSCPTAIDWQTSRLLCDGRLERHTLVLVISHTRLVTPIPHAATGSLAGHVAIIFGEHANIPTGRHASVPTLFYLVFGRSTTWSRMQVRATRLCLEMGMGTAWVRIS